MWAAGHHTGLLTDIFLPIGMEAPGLPDPAVLASGNGSSVELLGRLRPGVTVAQARRALGTAADAFGRQVGESSDRHPYAMAVADWGPLPSVVRPAVAAFLSVLFILVGLAMAMACMNVSTILLAQAAERQREIAVRRAIGASDLRLLRQVVTEVGVLFVAAGVIGVGAAVWATGLIGGFEPPVPLPGRLGADSADQASCSSLCSRSRRRFRSIFAGARSGMSMSSTDCARERRSARRSRVRSVSWERRSSPAPCSRRRCCSAGRWRRVRHGLRGTATA
jgi:hypothetical protein